MLVMRTLLLFFFFMFIFAHAEALSADDIQDVYVKPMPSTNPINDDAGIVYSGLTKQNTLVYVLFYYGKEKNYAYVIEKKDMFDVMDYFKLKDDWSIYDKLKSIADNHEKDTR